MPGRSKVEERAASDEEPDSHLIMRGNDSSIQTLDVYLNNTAYWKNIPPRCVGLHHRRLSGY